MALWREKGNQPFVKRVWREKRIHLAAKLSATHTPTSMVTDAKYATEARPLT